MSNIHVHVSMYINTCTSTHSRVGSMDVYTHYDSAVVLQQHTTYYIHDHIFKQLIKKNNSCPVDDWDLAGTCTMYINMAIGKCHYSVRTLKSGDD